MSCVYKIEYSDILTDDELWDPIFSKDLPCIDGGRWFCTDFHPKEFRIMCRQYSTCSYCRSKRRKRIYKIGTDRWKVSYYQTSNEPLVMWTLGTNWFDTKANRKKLSLTWKSFRKKLWRYYKDRGWVYPKFLLRVFEAGSTGNFLHIHILSEVGIPFRWMFRYWRISTRLKANVNYSFPMRCLFCYRSGEKMYLSLDKSIKCSNCHLIFEKDNWDRIPSFYAFLYVLKYASKSSGSYFWQGHILKAKLPPPELEGYCVWKNCILPLDEIEFGYSKFVVAI